MALWVIEAPLVAAIELQFDDTHIKVNAATMQ
jgi:hypothetical protein